MNRLDIHQLVSPRFDSDEGPATKAIYLCTSPRTASFTLCRLMIGQGWGIPNEYYSAHVARILAARWGVRGDPSAGAAARLAYGRELLRRRTSGGFFAAKLMAAQTRFFNKVHPKGFDASVQNHFIHLFREGFAAQVASLVTAATTNRWSFSETSTQFRILDLRLDRESVERACRLVIDSERFWKMAFAEHGIRPLEISSEAVVADPGRVVKAIAALIGETIDEHILADLVVQERGSAYPIDRALKHEILTTYGDVLEHFAAERREAYLPSAR
ncbi:Stf0 family sulfotransferase [Aquibium sp. ELW1220]|uniref:Stf0 family sulfotransferase n=1 Tax=Aquibium sp. ELW1220 TaxID=2976766 RepID=UPI0025AEF090|nr:Stf0 family sulfotransferase [Aquibium sp. ELW1220]MDN2578991.1 Stf0 family sulfotransferase [Aquibium sp. ELW1220]